MVVHCLGSSRLKCCGVAQVLNALMDVFSDDDLHPAFEAAELLPLLKLYLPKVMNDWPLPHLVVHMICKRL